MKQFRTLDWEAIMGIAAACVALLLHFLHVVEEGVLFAIALVLLALLLLRDLHRESSDEKDAESLLSLRDSVLRLESSIKAPEIVLVGPRDLRNESERFARHARGEMLWFNVCLSMFEPQELYDVLLRPAIENPSVTSIQFILNPGERARWHAAVLTKVRQTTGAAKVREPRWMDLEENISFILADNPAGDLEAHVSFWGEPFMARRRGQDVPRYVLHVMPGSALLGGLLELERSYHTTRNGDLDDTP